jgi:hypothetical protein
VTSGPQVDPTKVINIGVAAHITGASPEGPRYDPSLSSEQRSSADNGIWLCQSCGKLVDNDPRRYTVAVLKRWKHAAEAATVHAIEQRRGPNDERDAAFLKIEQLMPNLLVEMRKDLEEYPLSREFVVLKKAWVYWHGGHELTYYYDDHSEFDNKLRILQNLDLIQDISHNNTKRYIISERFVAYLNRLG